MSLSYIFITFLYQPFLNILVGFYWILDKLTGDPDMGIAVIFLTLLIRFLLLPLTLSGHRSEKDRRKIAEQVKEVEEIYAAEPIKMEKAKKKILQRSRGVVAGELVGLTIQVAVALMLWKMFETGLPGEDLHMIYSFMPEVEQPFNLVFLDRFDLSHTSLTLNFIQSFLIFVLETISMYSSPYPVSRTEVVRMQLVLPVVSFLIFMAMPAGKKLFVITALIVSIVIAIIRAVNRKFNLYKEKKIAEVEAKEAGDQPEKIVVQTK